MTSLHFQEDLLAVGLHGGVALLFNLNSQSAVINIKVFSPLPSLLSLAPSPLLSLPLFLTLSSQLVRVSIMRDDPRQRSRNWQGPLTLRTGGTECEPGYQPSHCVHLFPNIATTTLAVAKAQKL